MRKLALPVVAALTLLSSLSAVPRAGAVAGRRSAVPSLGHVFVIVGENTSLSQLTPANAPYLNRVLKPNAAWIENYRALADGSLADYIAMTSGQFTQCEVNNGKPHRCQQDVNNLFHQLDVAGIGWKEWMESATNGCDYYDSGTDWAKNVYGVHHDPAIYYRNIEGGSYSEARKPAQECITHVVPTGTTAPNDTSYLDKALAAGNVPRFNMIIPNDCEQGHDPCGTNNPVGQFDSFLKREIPKIQGSPAFGPNSVIFVTYDEGGDKPIPHRYTVLLAALGQQVQPGVYDGPVGPNHYSLLRTLEQGLGRRLLKGATTATSIGPIWA